MLQQVPKKNPIPRFNAPDQPFLNSKGKQMEDFLQEQQNYFSSRRNTS
jgi:hypothetical protein